MPRLLTSCTAALLLLLASTVTPAQSSGSPAQAPSGFRGITLGMSTEAVKAALAADPLFRYRGDPDVSLLPRSSQALIECAGSSFIRRAYFQFDKDRLFIMILVLEPERVDHYSIFTSLSRKYGPPGSLSPQESVWLFPALRLSLERPLTVKYIERGTFEAIIRQGAAQTDLQQVSRERFIEQF
jgi:hypothetical protein